VLELVSSFKARLSGFSLLRPKVKGKEVGDPFRLRKIILVEVSPVL